MGAASAAPMLLELRSITRNYRDRLALDRVSLSVDAGQCLGLLGHNGAGKTTLLRIALGLVRPTSGEVWVDGFRATSHPREARARLGGLIEVPGFLGMLSGVDNLARLSRLAGRSRREAKREAEELIEKVGLAHAAHRRLQGWSQGMRQRLGIAQALLGDPRLVVLDEPTNGLDPEGIAELRELVRHLVHDEGRAVILSSHQLGEVAGVASHVAVLRQGQLVARGSTRELLAGPALEYDVEFEDPEVLTSVLEDEHLSVETLTDGTRRVSLEERGPGELARVLTARGELVRFAPRQRTLEEIYLRGAEAAEALHKEFPDDQEEALPEPLAPYDPLRRVVRYELARAVLRPGSLALWAAPSLLALIAIARRAVRAASDESAVGGQEVFSATQVTAFEAFGIGLRAGLPLLGVLAVAFASQAIASELGRGTLRNLVLQPVGRIPLALGKTLGTLVGVALGYLLLLASTYGAARLWFEFSDVVEVLPNGATFPLVEAKELWPLLQSALRAPLLPLAALTALGVLASAWTRTAAGALGLGLGGLLTLDLARGIARGFGTEAWLPTAHLPSPLGDSSFLSYYAYAVTGVSNATYESWNEATISSVLVLAISIVLVVVLLLRRPIP